MINSSSGNSSQVRNGEHSLIPASDTVNCLPLDALEFGLQVWTVGLEFVVSVL